MARIAEQQVDRVVTRLAQAGIDVRSAEQGFEGLAEFGFRFQMTGATYASDVYGASLTSPGKTQAGVTLIDPTTVTLSVPSGSQIQSPLVLGTLGEITASMSATLDRQVEAIAISMDSMTLTALGGLLAMSGDGFEFTYGADGQFSAIANLDGVQIVEFMKDLIDKRLPEGLILPEEPVQLEVSGRIVPAGLTLERGGLGSWLASGGYIVVNRLNMPFHQKVLQPQKALIFASAGEVTTTILCPAECDQTGCVPTVVLRNQNVVDPEVVATLALPGRYQGLAGEDVCEVL